MKHDTLPGKNPEEYQYMSLKIASIIAKNAKYVKLWED